VILHSEDMSVRRDGSLDVRMIDGHPSRSFQCAARATDGMRRAEIDRLLDAVREVMLAAIAAGGTSFDALYVAVNGQSGWFDRSLKAYGRADEPCSRCGTPIVRMTFMNRSSYLCPHCQPRPRRGRW
jgi:formamidopyrimidine-DNA glycosylase